MVKNMKNSVNLTFGIPVYNSEKYIEELLDCFKQKAVINYEILIVNDGSTDNSLNIINTYNNKNIRVITKENGGVSTALNLGIEKSTGDYISWLSHDDIYYPNKLERQIEEISKYDDETILYSNYDLIDLEGNPLTIK